MSENPKKHLGIKLSRTPESTKSVQAQEEAIRALESPPRQLPDWRYVASDLDHDRGDPAS